MKKLLLLVIILLSFFLRFYHLGQNPPSLTWDETAWGYNAYSLGLDGRDEFGRFLPLDYLESFGDFKPPVYAYLTIIPIKIFGLNELSVRIPSALFGVLTVLATYFLTKRIFEKDSNKEQTEKIAFFASLFLAISPWHINLSRAAFEANLALFFIVSGVWMFLSWIKHNKLHYLLLSALSFVISIYTFNTARIVAPLLVFALSIAFLKYVLKRKKQVLIALIFGIILMIPVAGFLRTPQAKLRYEEVNIFSQIKIIEFINQEVANDNNSRFSKFIHNRRFTYSVEYLRHYFDHFNPDFLFIRGDGNPKFSTQDVGILYLWDLPFIIVGAVLLFRSKKGYWWLLFIWLLAAIVPAATARETPHALRIENALPTYQIIIAFGLAAVLKKVAAIYNIRIRRLIFSLIFLFLALNVFYYTRGYHAHYPREFSGEWQYGYKELVTYLKTVEKNYDQIYMTTELGRPYIYYLFYTKMQPDFFRTNSVVKRSTFGFVHVERLGRYNFLKDVKSKNISAGKNLFIDTKENFPSNANMVKEFKLLNGNTVLIAYTHQ